MKRSYVRSVLLFILLLLPGCAKVVITSDADPNYNFATLEKIYVQKLAQDQRGLEQIIAAKLQQFGFDATSGSNALPPMKVDAIVTYQDRWMWDMTNYMLEITIEFRTPESNYMFASGKSYRTSLARKPPEAMIEEALRDLFKDKIQLPQQ